MIETSIERVAARMEHCEDSPTLLIAARAQELRKQGRSIVSLSTGEPDFPTPENVKQAGIKAITESSYDSSPPEGS